ncbi:kinesin-like protein KIF26B [Gigantopelta aegis]|uniref:kinesin-like protein KIF26B n=1 Tax=Gigantopelta aegis TaxID=1735272 RepID=UPI001B888E09|nr:kinesin-like protein KIF26B [Gigantopelta aegis]
MEKSRIPRSSFTGWKGASSPQPARKVTQMGIYHQMSPNDKAQNQENGYCRTTQCDRNMICGTGSVSFCVSSAGGDSHSRHVPNLTGEIAAKTHSSSAESRESSYNRVVAKGNHGKTRRESCHNGIADRDHNTSGISEITVLLHNGIADKEISGGREDEIGGGGGGGGASVVDYTEYPIRGTISPLSSQGVAKRSAGVVDEVSFVFGRPATPITSVSERRCLSPTVIEKESAASGEKQPVSHSEKLSVSHSEKQAFSHSEKQTVSYADKQPVSQFEKQPISHSERQSISHSERQSISHSERGSPLLDILPLRQTRSVGGLQCQSSGERYIDTSWTDSSGGSSTLGSMVRSGVLCQHCNGCLVDLKRQALRLMFPDNMSNGTSLIKSLPLEKIHDKLQVPDSFRKHLSARHVCAVCETHVRQLKQEAISMIQSIQQAQSSSASPASIPVLIGSCNIMSTHQPNRLMRQGKSAYSSASGTGLPIAAQAQAYLEQNVRAWMNPKKCSQMIVNRSGGQDKLSNSDIKSSDMNGHVNGHVSSHVNGHVNGHMTGYAHRPGMAQALHHTSNPHWHQTAGQHLQQSVPLSPGSPPPHYAHSRISSSPSSPPPNPSAAVSFFARAAQKLSRKKKRHQPPDPEPPPFPTSFCEVIRLNPPPAPPCLFRCNGRLTNPGLGKVKVMLRLVHTSGHGEQGTSFLNVDPRKKQVTVYDPSAGGYMTTANRRAGTAAPKMFAFDSVFSPDDSLAEVCAGSLPEIVQSVVNGADGCLFTFGHSKLGKSYTMIGRDHSPQTLGIVPCSIAWLFRLINEQKEKTGARFSVRVSAVEVTGKQEILRDLLVDVAQSQEATGVGTAPGVYLREDPICGTQLENQSELRAPTAEKASYYLDAALASRAPIEDDGRSSHVLFTLHVYQYRIEKANRAGLPGVAGGRSRLHLIDLGSTSKSKDPNNVGLSLSALGNVIMALVNGQRHVPHRDSKIAQLLRDSLGSMSCRTCMIAHVSAGVPHYNETLQVIQLAARIHRMKRRRTKFSSTSSEDSSTDESCHFRRPYRGLRMGTLREDILYSSSHSDPDYTSSSEQSCDTVIYLGANGQSLSDRELTDNEGPPRHVPRTNPRLPRRPSGSRSSGDDSDSGRSVTYSEPRNGYESRLPVRASTPVRNVQINDKPQIHSAPGSPRPGMAMPHRADVRTKALFTKPQLPSEIKDINSHWSEKMRQHVSHHLGKKHARNPQESGPIQGEQWVDGPGAAIYPEKKKSKELWVDGPQAFMVASPEPTKTESKRSVINRKVSSEEQWVDGPQEMIAGPKREEVPVPLPAQPMHTCSKLDYSSESPKGSPKHQLKKPSDKVLKQAISKLIPDGKERPESTVSLESNLSTIAEASDSRPSSMMETSGQKPETTAAKPNSVPETKPFVRDWVHKHRPGKDQAVQSDSDTGMFIVDSDNRVIGTLESMSAAKKHKMSGTLGKKLQVSSSSPKHSPRNSPAIGRKTKADATTETTKLQKSRLPCTTNPTNRVAEWIKSVSIENDLDRATTDSYEVQMADAETNTEHDSDFERMAASDGSVKGSENQQCATKESFVSTEPDPCAVDTSYDSSMDTGELADTAVVTRDSIYEIEVEEQLEGLKRDGTRLQNEIPDDETFSSISKTDTNDDNDKGESQSVMESVTEQHMRALTSGSSSISKGLGKVLFDRESSPVLSEYDNEQNLKKDVPMPMLFRRPDGASNPNLMKELFQEEQLGKDILKQSYTLSSDSVDGVVASVTSSHNDSGISSVSDIPTTSSFVLGPSSKPGKTGSDYSVPEVQSLTLSGTVCKSQVQSKPPLPQKPNGSPKASSLPKPSSPSRQLASSSKNVLKDLSTNQNQTSKTSIPVSSHSSVSKEKEKSNGKQQKSNSASSVNGVSKNGSKNGKTSNGVHSKLPVFSSSRTSSPSKDLKPKKDKDSKSTKLENVLVSELMLKNKGNDSDSGNDSGIVAHEKLLSPYATVTKPRTPSHSSSGHGSDNSSTISTGIHSHHGNKSDKLHGGTSSGYESMLRDSEATGSSGHEGSASESSQERKKGSKRKGTRRSRSAPARSSESPPESCKPSPSVVRKNPSVSARAWVDTRYIHKSKEEPFEIKKYDISDVEKLQRWRQEESEGKITEQQRCERMKELLCKQEDLKQDLSTSTKDRIIIERSTWTFDCKFLMCFSCKSRSQPTDV